VTAKTTSGTPINPQGSTYWAATGAFISLLGGSDSPPGLGGGGSARGSAGNPFGALPRTQSGKNAAGGDPICPNGYGQVTGAFYYGFLAFNDPYYEYYGIAFTATSFPTARLIKSYGPGENVPGRGTASKFRLFEDWTVSWVDPVLGARSESVQAQIGNGSTVEPLFPHIRLFSYSCKNEATVNAKLRTVAKGDTLWDIAEDEYGDATRWPEIYAANTDVVGADPDLIFPGQVLRIP
jgi:hypothetical protein